MADSNNSTASDKKVKTEQTAAETIVGDASAEIKDGVESEVKIDETVDVPEEHSGEPDMKQLRGLICDIMRKPEEFFWSSTMRELVERWTAFAVAKGYMKKPERMQMFDTEGME